MAIKCYFLFFFSRFFCLLEYFKGWYQEQGFAGRVERLVFFKMGIFAKLKDWIFRTSPLSNSAGGVPPARAPRTGGGFPLLSSANALNIATVYRCVNLLADSVAMLPVQYMRKKGDIFMEDRSDRMHYLLNVQPCEWLSAVDFWQQVVDFLYIIAKYLKYK